MIILRSVYDKDQNIYHTNVKFLYKLLSERKEYQSISHRTMPTMNNHIKFVDLRPYREWYIINDGMSLIGSVYITEKSEIGLSILEEHQEKGYGTLTLTTIFNKHPKEIFYANINPRNHKSINLFKKMGFIWKSNSSKNNLDVYQETYVRI